MAKLDLPDAKKVLAFNSARVLVAVYRSVRAAAEATYSTAQGISNCCNGHSRTALGYYWRHENNDIEIEISDIGELRIEEYDKLCGEEREYVSSYRMKHKRTIPIKNGKVKR